MRGCGRGGGSGSAENEIANAARLERARRLEIFKLEPDVASIFALESEEEEDASGLHKWNSPAGDSRKGLIINAGSSAPRLLGERRKGLHCEDIYAGQRDSRRDE